MPETGRPGYEGRLIGSYRLRERIGEGGMGEVYLAEREGEFRQQVAVKLIRAGMANPEIVRRFVVERQTLAALRYPHIVRLLDGGATEEGLPYLVVEYVKGAPIDRYCDDRKLDIGGRLRLFVDVAMAVHHAHQSLIVHCDLKPGNILVTPEGQPMLLDFGIAKLLDPVSIGISLQTAKTRLRSYTACYASPEQLRGEPVKTASDIYSLGVVLYELLTGHSPYRAKATDSVVEWVRWVCERDPEPPSTALDRVSEIENEDDGSIEIMTPERVSQNRGGDLPSLRRGLRGDLDAIVLKALRKDPVDRYGSVDQMAEDIRRHLGGRPVLARRNTARYVVNKFLQRHKLGAAAAVLLTVTLVGGVASTLWQARVAARRFDDLRRLARTFLFDVHDSIQDTPGTTAARDLIAKTGTEYLDRLARDAAGDVSLQLELAEGYVKVGDVEGDPFASNLGESEKAIANYRKALSIAEPVLARNPKDGQARRIAAQCHYRLSGILPFHSKAAEGLDHAKEALRLYIRIAAAHPGDTEAEMDVARGYEAEADVLGGLQGINLGRTQEAMDAYRQSLSMIPTLPPGHPSAVRATRSRAVQLMKIGRMEENAGNIAVAFTKYRSALESAEGLYQADPSSTSIQGLVTSVLNNLAAIEGITGDFKGAEGHFLKAIQINENSLSAEPNNEKARGNVITTQTNLGNLFYYDLKNLPEALRCYRRAGELLDIECRVDPKKIVWRQRLAEILTDIASCLMDAGQPQEARREAQRGLVVAKEVADSPGATRDQIYNYAWLAATVDPADLRDYAAALPYALRAVAMSNPVPPLCLHVLAQSYAGTGDYQHAVETEEKALRSFPPGEAATRNQKILQDALEEFRKELAKRGGPG
jgi:serine/threonine protein kinase/tetratricopeptide (TPR) repeat protein